MMVTHSHRHNKIEVEERAEQDSADLSFSDQRSNQMSVDGSQGGFDVVRQVQYSFSSAS